MRFLSKLFKRRRPRETYVIVFDVPGMEDNNEQYYGYFADPLEARHLWLIFTQCGLIKYENVKLCRVVEDW